MDERALPGVPEDYAGRLYAVAQAARVRFEQEDTACAHERPVLLPPDAPARVGGSPCQPALVPGSTPFGAQTDAAFICNSLRVSLADGTEVWIRPLRLNDREALTELYGRLGQHSRYQRFFACPARLPASWADGLLEPSPRRLGLVAEPVGEPHRIVALADCTVSADAESAEVGLLVEDAWQHNGLGRALFNHLLVLGESRGICSFVAYVHWSNLRVIHALGRMVTIVNRAVESSVVKFTFTRQRDECIPPLSSGVQLERGSKNDDGHSGEYRNARHRWWAVKDSNLGPAD
jgi:GNAT superfamily N-acetyltransferase